MEYTQTTKAPSNVHEMPSQSEEMLGLRAAMDEYMATAADKAREAYAYADRRVQQNPWTAVGVGFGVGMMFGALVAIVARGSAR
jgi:ElaB/YqjD/DUF883 family membrane-anchored ribosome-binding protein